MDDPIGIISQFQAMHGVPGTEGIKGMFNLIDGVNLAFYDQLKEAQAAAGKVGSSIEGDGAAKTDVKAESNAQPQGNGDQQPEEFVVEAPKDAGTEETVYPEVSTQLPKEAVQEAEVPKQELKADTRIAEVVKIVAKQGDVEIDVNLIPSGPVVKEMVEKAPEVVKNSELPDVVVDDDHVVDVPIVKQDAVPKELISVQKKVEISKEEASAEVEKIEAKVVLKESDPVVNSVRQSVEIVAPLPVKPQLVEAPVAKSEEPLSDSFGTEEDATSNEKVKTPKIAEISEYHPEQKETLKGAKQPVEKPVVAEGISKALKVESSEVPNLEVVEAPVTVVEPEQAQQILKDLNSLVRSVQPQPTDVSKLSSKIIDALKEGNARVTQNMQVVKANPVPQEVAAKMREAQVPGNKSKEFQSAKATYEDPRMERLRKSIMEQVRYQMQVVLKGKTGVAMLHLRPAMLGSVKVKLAWEGNKVDAHFTVENNTVKEVLQKEIAELKSLLTGKGVDVSNIEVSVSDDQGGSEGKGKRSMSSAQDQAAAREWIRSFISVAAPEKAEVPSSTSGDIDPNQIINIVV